MSDQLREFDVFGEEFLLERPLLACIRQPEPAVLLVDEIDRADEAFEAYLLELLSDFQLSIPELGTIRAKEPPVVIVTSNRTREVHDALRRRCLYHWVDYPSIEAEQEILARKAPGLPAALRDQLVRFIHRLRDEDLFKRPGVAETTERLRARFREL